MTLLGRDYWLVLSTPAETTTTAEIESHVESHVAWLLQLEKAGTVFLSGPLTTGPRVRPGSGVTVLRAESAEHARTIAESDPFVLAGLRSVEIFGWRVNEGAVEIRISLGAGTHAWA
ncbi:YciI family protein [Cryptosporangium sp. NPDC051539]|uniref:YciI family protein n=1 Tax=Cryptosporangium sp. NPDC051539 TaxID=3363962 RepID=UPI003790C4B5